MITIVLNEFEAAHLYDEVSAANMSMVRGMSRYERGMIRACREVRIQLAEQGVTGVLAAAQCDPLRGYHADPHVCGLREEAQ